MDENQVGKKRRTGKEVQRLVEELISGGIKRSEFCRTRGLSPGTLQRHLKGGKQGARQIPRLVVVELEMRREFGRYAFELSGQVRHRLGVCGHSGRHEQAVIIVYYPIGLLSSVNCFKLGKRV
jgi:hypothetical protein